MLVLSEKAQMFAIPMTSFTNHKQLSYWKFRYDQI